MPAASSAGPPSVGGARQRLAESLPEQSDTAGEEFKSEMARLFLRNKMSAKEVIVLVQQAYRAGISEVGSMARASGSSGQWSNAARNLTRVLLRGVDFPDLYWAQVPCHNPETGANRELHWIPFLLPHEVLSTLVERDPSIVGSASRLIDESPLQQEIEDFCRVKKVPVNRTMLLGIHGDGVPHRTRSTVETVSWNLAALPLSDRFLFALLEKDFLCRCGCSGRCSLDSMLQVFVWSCKHMCAGQWPTARHDDTPWIASDKSRKARGGSLGFHALLVQARGDWAWFKQLFSFPSWSGHSICWQCGADRSDKDFTDFGLKAAWRRCRYTPREFSTLQRQQGIQPSPLFQCPNFKLSMVCIDILHTMDLGVTQDCLGCLFWYSTETHFPGTNRKERVHALWKAIKAHYKVHKTPTRLQDLTVEMIRRQDRAPQLRAKGGETRGLVPFGLVLACQMQESAPCTYNDTLKTLMARLLDLYMLTLCGQWHPEVAGKTCREFLLLYSALNKLASGEGSALWHVKPKFHLMQELFEYQGTHQGNPRHFWCYRDESFVGLIGTVAHTRGGNHSPATVPVATLNTYRALTD